VPRRLPGPGPGTATCRFSEAGLRLPPTNLKAMEIYRQSPIHVRFEPQVDHGTTYAFNFTKSKLVIGRENLYRLIMAVPPKAIALETLCTQLIETDPGERAYGDQAALLQDLLRLVDAEVLGVTPPEDSPVPPA
jgi:hypothetical protein